MYVLWLRVCVHEWVLTYVLYIRGCVRERELTYVCILGVTWVTCVSERSRTLSILWERELYV